MRCPPFTTVMCYTLPHIFKQPLGIIIKKESTACASGGVVCILVARTIQAPNKHGQKANYLGSVCTLIRIRAVCCLLAGHTAPTASKKKMVDGRRGGYYKKLTKRLKIFNLI